MKRAGLIALIALAVTARTGHADDTRAVAERYFRAGAKAYAAQNFAAAVADFDEAYKALPMPEIAFSAAQAYRRLYRSDPQPQYVRHAVELYRVYLAKVKTGGRVGDAADSLGEMERELDRLEARGARTKIEVVERTRMGVNIAIADQTAETAAVREIGEGTGELLKGVTALLDGKRVEPYALIDVAAGDHTISVTAEGYFPVDKKQRAVPGAASLVEIELRPRPATVTVKTESGARIVVDGRGATSAVLELTAGKHVLAVVRRGREPFTRELGVSRGQALVIDAPLVKTARRRAVPWVLGGAGVLAAGTLATSIAALVHDGRASDLRAQLAAGNAPVSAADAYDREVASRDRFKTGALVLGGSALVANAVGAALYLFDAPSSEAVRVTPAIAPGTAGLGVSGRF